MNRHSLLSVVSTLFHAGSAAPAPTFLPEGLAGRAFIATAGASPGYLTVIVRRAPSAPAAERTRLALLAQAGDIERGMHVHATHVTGRTLPSPLAQGPGAGSLVTWDTVAGIPAVRTRWAAGYFRRDELTWEIIATGADADDLARLVVDLATDLTAREVSEPCAAWMGGLWSLLPTESDLPAPLRLETVFDNDRIYDLAALAA